MFGGPQLIMIIDDVLDRAQNLKALIEFMDVPRVRVAGPDGWQEDAGEARLAAVFVSRRLATDVLQRVISEVGERDANVPIVLVDGR